MTDISQKLPRTSISEKIVKIANMSVNWAIRLGPMKNRNHPMTLNCSDKRFYNEFHNGGSCDQQIRATKPYDRAYKITPSPT